MEKQFKVNVAKSRLSVGYTNNDQVFLDLWENSHTFEKVNQNLFQEFSGKPFVLLDGPPYANGQAHMGHALNKTFKDLVVKSRWFLGQPVDYRPGWDTHGLPLELAVEKKYGKLDTSTLKTRCKQLAFRSLVKQRKSFKRLGVLGEWNNPYVTLSKDMVQSSWATLKSLVDNNLLEYKQYPVHYCPACASSLAEAELESQLLQKDSLYFKMPLELVAYPNSYALVWTTTPWTLPMNQAVAFNPDYNYQVWANGNEHVVFENSENPEVLKYLELNGFNFVVEKLGKDLEFTQATSPLTKLVVPVLAASFVEHGKTGFVHVACAHGPEDFELGKENGLFPLTYLNKYGAFEFEEGQSLFELHGKKHTVVQELVCSLLSKNNLLVDYSQSQVEQQVCWRHKKGVYYNATWQAFLKLEDPAYHLKNKVSSLLNTSNLSNHYKERLGQMLMNRSHWCLSRQRKWGVPMNLLVDKKTKKISSYTSQYLDYLAKGQEEQAQLFLNEHLDLEVFDDVLDVWFDSGNVVNHYAAQHQFDSSGVVDLVLEGKDQFRGWFQSMLWLSVAVNNTMPYKDLFCHGFVLDEKRQKFSKSAGNGSLVDVYADQHGADVLHLWVSAQEPELDPVFSDKKLDEMKKYYSRLRLALRFTTSNLYDYDYSQHTENMEKFSQQDNWDLHRYALSEMYQTYNDMKKYLEKYHFRKALEVLYFFCDKTLSNFYFDWTKNSLYLRAEKSEERLATQTALFELLNGLFDMVKVFAPFVAEEFYQDFFNSSSVLEQFYFNHNKVAYLSTFSTKVDWNGVLESRKSVQTCLEPLQKSKIVKARTEVNALVKTNGKALQDLLFVSKHYKLGEVLAVSNTTVMEGEEQVQLEVLNNNPDYKKCPRCWNYEHLDNFNACLCHDCNKAENN